MRAIYIVDKKLFADERGNICSQEEFFDCYSFDDDWLSIKSVSVAPNWFSLTKSTGRRERIQNFNRFWQLIENLSKES